MHKYESAKMPVGIVGARGYSGLELARLLLAHPTAALSACFASDPNAFRLGNELFAPEADAVSTLPMSALDAADLGLKFHTIFLATPAEVSLELAPKLVAKGVNVVDLSGAFRLASADYPKWYGFEHTAPAALAAAQYGLVPFAKPFVKEADKGVLVSNPGCYVTAVLMALIPLVKEGVIDPESIVIDAKSGTTGAGKKASEGLLFSEVDGECFPYKIGKHQHFPEITKYLAAFGGSPGLTADDYARKTFFSTSLLPTPRGIIAGMYLSLAAGKTEADVAAAFATAYADYPLAKVAALSAAPKIASLKKVVGSNRVQIGYALDGAKLYLYSLVDNLLKGAASQAVENFNRIVDLPVASGLTPFTSDVSREEKT
jgi:N-acetyl-gamma-glutamyl-phosphate reductase